jgi:hypothetical protein
MSHTNPRRHFRISVLVSSLGNSASALSTVVSANVRES